MTWFKSIPHLGQPEAFGQKSAGIGGGYGIYGVGGTKGGCSTHRGADGGFCISFEAFSISYQNSNSEV